MSVATYDYEPLAPTDSSYRNAKRFKTMPVGFVEEVGMPSETNADKLYILIVNPATNERRCPCTNFTFVSRQGGVCKHVSKYLSVLAEESRNDPAVVAAGQIVDEVLRVVQDDPIHRRYIAMGTQQRNRAVGLVADRLRSFVPRAGQPSSGAAATGVPGLRLRRIRF